MKPVRTAMKKKILVLVETSRTYGRQIIAGITRYAKENGRWAIYLEDHGLQYGNKYRSGNIRWDGVISRTVDTPGADLSGKRTIPAVELLGDGVSGFSEILCDGKRLGFMAADYYRKKGFQNFAFFSTGHTWWSLQFCDAYIAELRKNGFSCHISPSCKRKSNASLPLLINDGMECKSVDWLHSLPKPIALFCPSDSQAILAANLAEMAEIAIPHQMAILGVENNEILCETITPPLSSIAVDGRRTGYLAASLLDGKMRGDTFPSLPIYVAPLGVVERQSTDFIAVSDPGIAKALHYIANNAGLQISVKKVAAEVGLSVRTLIRRFHELLGSTPEQEMLRARIKRAKMLLYETDMKISAIAENLGYSTSEHFIRAFRREMQITPAHYRQSVRSENDG